ncbi:GspE/PulE family protein [Verrucomicrobium spinosum]|uniref:GspE/PulE family protein n=2 Tax=Verrucomicrobium spinosum TaxID=2736 RepID=UPI0001744DAF|nr:GspE/PulE family protein [Verrucomicrobium spinosum]
MISFLPNPRPVEPRLAPQYHAYLGSHPPVADEPRTQERATALLADAVQWRASDVHIEPASEQTRIRFRIDGVLHDVAEVPNFSGHRLVAYFKIQSQINATAIATPEHGHCRMAAGGTVLELRTTVAPTVNGEMIGIRLLDTQRPLLRLDDLGMKEEDQRHLRTWLEGMQGMLLVCGPVGTGKTSTLYALLHELQKEPRSIVTVEDPVECNLDGITQIEVHVKRGMTFPEAMRAMLRLDPDYLLVGEIRDSESAHVAITAAGSGQTLLSTLHARDAVGAVTTLRNYGLQLWEVAAAIELCVSQRLVRRLCTKCRSGGPPGDEAAHWYGELGLPVPEQIFSSVGCDACGGTGYQGRLGIFEVWRIDAEAREMILRGADDLQLTRHAMAQGMQPLLSDALAKASAGLTSFAEVRILAAEVRRTTGGLALRP